MKTKLERQARRKRILAKIKTWFKKLDDVILPKANELALKFMKAVKTFSENETADFLAKLLLGDKADDILQKTHKIIDKSVVILGITNECMQEEDLSKKIQCIFNKIKDLPKEERAFKLNSLHALALSEYDNKKEEMAVYLAQAPIDFLKENNI